MLIKVLTTKKKKITRKKGSLDLGKRSTIMCNLCPVKDNNNFTLPTY